jgi:acyl dehydratase
VALDYNKIKNWDLPVVIDELSEREIMLYALSIGYGYDPVDESQLNFCYEQNLSVAPTIASVLGYPGFWPQDPATGLDWVRAVHAEERLTLHAPIPASGTLTSRTRVKAIVDKGPDVGALVYQERTLLASAGELVATVEHVTMCRGDGGFGGGDTVPRQVTVMPDAPPDMTCTLPTLPQAALLFRLTGDRNPLHADPAVARAAGFPRPLLHGLVTFGVAGHAILRSACDYDFSQLRNIAGRFASPVFPGETLRTEMWWRGAEILFQVRVAERDAVVISHGRAEVGGA